MSITNITLVYEYYDMFTNVDGVNVGGWVGFGLFLVLGIITGVLAVGKKIKDAEDIYRILLYCGALTVAYLLTALEQFIIVRDDKQHINLLMAVVNALVWMFVVLCTSGRWTYAMNPVMRKYAIIIGVSSQVILISGAFVWNAAVYAVWGIGFLAMQASLAHWCVAIWMQASTRGAESRYNKTWLVLAFVYTYMYAGVAFLSHMYLGVMSIAGAVWTYLFLHAFAYIMLFELQRVKPSTSQLDLAQRTSDRMVSVGPDA